MTIDIVVVAEDFYTNEIYFIRENGHWSSMTENATPISFSFSSSKSAKLYIALENSNTKDEAMKAIGEHCDYLKKGSAK